MSPLWKKRGQTLGQSRPSVAREWKQNGFKPKLSGSECSHTPLTPMGVGVTLVGISFLTKNCPMFPTLGPFHLSPFFPKGGLPKVKSLWK